VYPWNTGPAGDEPPIHIESKITKAWGRPDAGDNAPGHRSSAIRVVRGPGRWSRLVGVVGMVGLLTGGLLWWASDAEEDDGGGDEPYCGIAGDRERAARIAFFEAGHRLVQVGSFANRGEVHAAEQSPFPPSGWTARDVTVEGAVVLEDGLTHDIAVDASGRAVEIMTSGPNLWIRRASTVEGLGADSWVFRASARPLALGPTMLHVVLSARDPREETPDAAGRCVIRATMLTADPHDVYGELLVGTNVLITLDEDGNFAHIIVRSAPDTPELVVELDVARVGEPQAIAPPHSG
jgi:hypothetical protein